MPRNADVLALRVAPARRPLQARRAGWGVNVSTTTRGAVPPGHAPGNARHGPREDR